jgi:hypothetical protein
MVVFAEVQNFKVKLDLVLDIARSGRKRLALKWPDNCFGKRKLFHASFHSF